jgi:hypothetical protein
MNNKIKKKKKEGVKKSRLPIWPLGLTQAKIFQAGSPFSL